MLSLSKHESRGFILRQAQDEVGNERKNVRFDEVLPLEGGGFRWG
jgi:hypothetical protein